MDRNIDRYLDVYDAPSRPVVAELLVAGSEPAWLFYSPSLKAGTDARLP